MRIIHASSSVLVLLPLLHSFPSPVLSLYISYHYHYSLLPLRSSSSSPHLFIVSSSRVSLVQQPLESCFQCPHTCPSQTCVQPSPVGHSSSPSSSPLPTSSPSTSLPPLFILNHRPSISKMPDTIIIYTGSHLPQPTPSPSISIQPCTPSLPRSRPPCFRPILLPLRPCYRRPLRRLRKRAPLLFVESVVTPLALRDQSNDRISARSSSLPLLRNRKKYILSPPPPPQRQQEPLSLMLQPNSKATTKPTDQIDKRCQTGISSRSKPHTSPTATTSRRTRKSLTSEC
ncbi:hypothetical protein F5H01DRAFT_348482 [Linnemannia elongata]|nr:hypothetical protein F5H01DRAFT_348482 [Linnemannia elongata]